MAYPMARAPTFAEFLVKAKVAGVEIKESNKPPPEEVACVRYLQRDNERPVALPKDLHDDDRLDPHLLSHFGRRLGLDPMAFGFTIGWLGE